MFRKEITCAQGAQKKKRKEEKKNLRNSIAGLANYGFFISYAYETTLQEQETMIPAVVVFPPQNVNSKNNKL